MAEYAQTLEEELRSQGVVANYIWKPNRLFAKSGNRYISADIVSDGSAAEVAEAVGAAGNEQISAINALAEEQKALLRASEKNYAAVKANLIQTYRRMYNYFTRQGLYALATIMATAIVNLEQM